MAIYLVIGGVLLIDSKVRDLVTLNVYVCVCVNQWLCQYIYFFFIKNMDADTASECHIKSFQDGCQCSFI